MKFSNEFKTGIMVLLSFGILVAMILKVADFGWESRGYHVKVLFDYGGGVLKNAPVRLAGVEVGKVYAVDILYGESNTKVQLDLIISNTAKIREDCRVYIATVGLMGEKYVEISHTNNKGNYVENGAVLNGENPFQMEEIVDNANSTLGELKNLAININKMIEENRGVINDTLVNFKVSSINFAEFSSDIRNHPWKLFIKHDKKSRDSRDDKRERVCVQKNRTKLLD